VNINPQFQIPAPILPRTRRRVPHTCPGDSPVLAVLPLPQTEPLPELIYCEQLQRVAAVVMPRVLPADLVNRCIQIGGIGVWNSWTKLAKAWGVWAVFADERWAMAQTVLAGSRPRGWKFTFLS